MGALVRLAKHVVSQEHEGMWWARIRHDPLFSHGADPEAALTEALLAALEAQP
jgi:hypothetical protein